MSAIATTATPGGCSICPAQPGEPHWGNCDHKGTVPTLDEQFADAARTEYPVHPAAGIFPMLGWGALSELAKDIKEGGLRDPIVLYNGTILDGRNRLRACRVAHVEPRFEVRDDITDPIHFVMSVNLHRRHLDESQRAMVAARLRTFYAAAAKERRVAAGKARHGDAEASATLQGPAVHTDEITGKQLAVSPRSIASATTVLRKGAPELVERVDRGETPVSTAADLASLPIERQREIIRGASPKVLVQEAKKIRAAKAAKRVPLDAYMSAGGFVRPLLPFLGDADVGLEVLECCAGKGDLVEALRHAGHRVTTADLSPDGSPDYVLDMRREESWKRVRRPDWVVSNLPFSSAIEILPHALKRARIGVAVILRLTFLEPTADRAEWLAAHPLTGQIILPRYSFTGDGNVDSVTCAWMIWEHGKPPAIFIPKPDADGMPTDCVVQGRLPLPLSLGRKLAEADGYACLGCGAGPGEQHTDECDDAGRTVPSIEEQDARSAIGAGTTSQPPARRRGKRARK